MGNDKNSKQEEMAGLRERKRAALRKKLVNAAIDLYLEQGYQRTKIEDITTAVDVSRRTFFHYFAGKDDVVTGWFMEQVECMRDTFEARPAMEPVWDSLLEACYKLFVTFGVSRERASGLRKLVYSEPALFARKYDYYLRAQAEMVPVVQRRLGRKGCVLAANILVRAALAAQDTAGVARTQEGLRMTPRRSLEKAFAMMRPAVLDEL